MNGGDQVKSISELRQVANKKLSVISRSQWNKKPWPASFALNFNASTLDRYFRSGLFIYDGRPLDEYKEREVFLAPHWQTLCQKEKERRLQAEQHAIDMRGEYRKSMTCLAEQLLRHIEIHHENILGYFVEKAEVDSGIAG